MAGEYTVSVATTFIVAGKERTVVVDTDGKRVDLGSDKALTLDRPMQSSTGKRLTTVSVAYQAPVGT